MLKLTPGKQVIGIMRCILHKKKVLWKDYIAHVVHGDYLDLENLKK